LKRNILLPIKHLLLHHILFLLSYFNPFPSLLHLFLLYFSDDLVRSGLLPLLKSGFWIYKYVFLFHYSLI
jgi:hypothetical protein